MPVRKVKGGYKWGGHGKVYPTKEAAEKQARAAFANGWRGDSRFRERAKRRELAKALTVSKRVEDRYVRDLKTILRSIHKAYMDVYAPALADRSKLRQDVGISQHNGNLAALGYRVQTKIKPLVTEAFDRMSDDIRSKPFPKIIGIAPSDTRIAGVIAVKRDENIRLVENAARDYAASVREIFDDPDNFGMRVEDLADMLEERGDVSESRASLIARDQTLKLNGAIAQTRMENAGITSYTWSTSQDERVRPMHRELEGSEQDFADPPETNDDGDRNNPGEDFQCRCLAIPIIAELDDI